MAGLAKPRDDGTKGLERLLQGGSSDGAADSVLLDRFVQDRDEAAFSALVDRHGPMVLGICRRYLRDPNDADDAFQAVFLVLARKGGGLGRKELLANWLFGVACRVASRGRVLAIRRGIQDSGDDGRRLEVDARRPPSVPPAEAMIRDEERSRLAEAVQGLPGRYRAPVVACYFEGRTHEEAATLLNCPVGTVKGRLSRARDLLRRRLKRQGVAAPAVALATAMGSPDLRAEVTASLAARAARSALAIVSSPPSAWMTTSAVPVTVRTLTEGVIQAMFYSQLKSMAIPAILVAGLLLAGANLATGQDGAAPSETKTTSDDRTKVTATTDQEATPADAEEAEEKVLQTEGDGRNAATKSRRSTNGAGRSPAFGGMGGMMGMMGGGMGGMGGGMGAMGGQGFVSPNMIPRLAAILSTYNDDPESRPVQAALEQRITLTSSEGSNFGDLLKQIRTQVKVEGGKPIPIFVNPVGLEEAGVDLGAKVEIDLPDVPLKTSLRLMLKGLGLAYCVRDGVLIISSLMDVQQELLEEQNELLGKNPELYQLGPDGIIQKINQGGFQ